MSEALELRHIQYLDIGKLNLVARIDLTEWKTQGIRVVISPSARAGSVASWGFLHGSAGAREGMDAKIQNKGLLQAVDDYCDSRQLEPAERNDYKKQVFKYCTEQASAGERSRSRSCRRNCPVMGTSILQLHRSGVRAGGALPGGPFHPAGLDQVCGLRWRPDSELRAEVAQQPGLLRSPDRHPDHQGSPAQSQGSIAAPVVM